MNTINVATIIIVVIIIIIIIIILIIITIIIIMIIIMIMMLATRGRVSEKQYNRQLWPGRDIIGDVNSELETDSQNMNQLVTEYKSLEQRIF